MTIRDFCKAALIESIYWLVLGPIAVGGFVLLAYGMAGFPPINF